MNIEEMLRELVKFSRDTKDYVKVEKMTAVVAGQIEREISARQVSAMTAQITLVESVIREGHA